MNYVDTPLYIPHKVESDFDISNKEENEIDQTIRYLNNLVELNYINLSENTLNITKAGYDYFMRKCQLEDNNFQFDKMAPMDIQQMIYQHFFAGKDSVNTVEKFIKLNLTI